MNRLPDRKKVIRHAVDTNIDTTHNFKEHTAYQ